MASIKTKFYTKKYQQQMSMLCRFFNVNNDDFLRDIIARTPAPTNVVLDMNLDEMIVTLSREIENLSKIDPKLIIQSQNAYKYEEIEDRITQIKSVLKNKFDEKRKADGFNKEQYKEYEFINSFMDMYDILQEKLNSMSDPYSPEEEISSTNNAVSEYMDYQPLFLYSVFEYNKYLKSNNTNIEILPEKVKNLIGNGACSAEDLLDRGDISSILEEISKQFSHDVASVKSLSDERNNMLQSIKDKRSLEIARENEKYDKLLQNEKDRHRKTVTSLNSEMDRLSSVINYAREKSLDCQYEDNVSYYRSQAFDFVSSVYKNGGFPQENGVAPDNWIENIGTLEEIAYRENILKEEIAKLNEDKLSATNELEVLSSKSEEYALREVNLKDIAKTPLSEDKVFIRKQESYTRLENDLREVSALFEAITNKGPKAITQEILNQLQIEETAIDYGKQQAEIDLLLNDLRSQIGKGKLFWSKQGKELAKSMADLDKIFNEDLSRLDLDLENDSDSMFKLDENLKNNFYGLCLIISETNSIYGNFTNEKESLCLLELVKCKNSLKSLAESISEEGDKHFVEIRNALILAVQKIDQVEKDNNIYSKLQRIENLLDNQSTEEKLYESVLSKLNEKKLSMENQLNTEREEIEGYENQRQLNAENARNDLLQHENRIIDLREEKDRITRDLRYLNLSLAIAQDQLEQKSDSLNKGKALDDFERVRSSLENENQWFEQNTEALLQNHISNLAILQNSQNDMEQAIDNSTHDKMLPLKDKIEQLQALNLHLDKLSHSEKNLLEKADSAGIELKNFLDRKQSYLDKLIQDKVSLMLKINKLESQTIEKIKNAKKEYGNTAQFKEMMDTVSSYLSKRDDMDMALMSSARYLEISGDARTALIKFNEKSNKNLSKLDAIPCLVKIMDLEEHILSMFDNEEKNIGAIDTNVIELKTIAEKYVLNRCINKPNTKESSSFSNQVDDYDYGNEIETMYMPLIEMGEGVSETIGRVIREGIEAISNGDYVKFEKAVAASILSHVLKTENPKNIAELENVDIADKLIDVYCGIDLVKDYANKLFLNEINPTEFKNEIESIKKGLL